MKLFYYLIFIILINWGSSIKAQEIQNKLLEKELANWMKNEEQIDDICVMGVKVLD